MYQMYWKLFVVLTSPAMSKKNFRYVCSNFFLSKFTETFGCKTEK